MAIIASPTASPKLSSALPSSFYSLFYYENFLCFVIFNNETDQARSTPARTLRSAKKKPLFTSIQETTRGNKNTLFRSSISESRIQEPANTEVFFVQFVTMPKKHLYKGF